jgi:hypothetical protein
MTAKELFEYLTQDAGLDEATAKAVMTAAANEKVGAKATSLVQKKEYDDLEAKAAALELSLNGNGKKMGAKAYQEWYDKNYSEVVKLQEKAKLYEERYGTLESPTTTTTTTAAPAFKPEDIQRIVNETIQSIYAPKWSELLTGTGNVVQKHMLAGRKNPIDFTKLSEIAATKGGDLNAAYDVYDAPERELAAKASTDAEVERRVKEGIAKAQTANLFPAGADATPSSGTAGITRVAADKKYDRSAVIAAAVTGKYEGNVQ